MRKLFLILFIPPAQMRLVYANITLADTSDGVCVAIDFAPPVAARDVQLAKPLRAALQKPYDRRNTQVSCAFTVLREFASRAAAETWMFSHPVALAAATATGVVFAGDAGGHVMADAVLQGYSVTERTGVSLSVSYQFVYSQYALAHYWALNYDGALLSTDASTLIALPI